MRINVNDNTNFPATLEDYTNLAKANATNAEWWGQCENGWAHGLSNRPAATHLVADEYYRTYSDAMKDGVNYGIKMCTNCVRYIRRQRDTPFVLFKRPVALLTKRHNCGAEIFNESGEVTKVCNRVGTHYVLSNGKRIWKCANHVAPYLKAGFETFFIRKDGQVKCTTEMLWDLLGL